MYMTFYPSHILRVLTFGILLFFIAIASGNTEPAKITVKPLKSLLLKSKHSAPAHIVSLNQSPLSAQLSAEVKKIKVDIGDNVKKGSVLVELDCRDYHYVVQQTKATYLARKAQATFAKQTFLRNQRLSQQSTIPRASLEQAESDHLSIQEDLKALQAQFNTAKLNVERCVIRAPFAGQITQRYIQQGQLVIPNTPVFELLQTAELYVDAELSHHKVNSIKQAKQILFRVNNQATPLKLEKIVSLIKQNTQTQAARFSLIKNKKQQNPHLITGVSGRIVWQHNQAQLPANYLSRRNGQYGVLIAQRKTESKNQAVVNFITLPHAQEGQATDIDLPSDSLIIDTGRLYVNDKQTVVIQALSPSSLK